MILKRMKKRKIKMPNKTMLSIYNEDSHQGIKFIQQNEPARPEDYYELGSGWFQLPNFHEDRMVGFKISTLKRKNKFGLRVLVMDFVCMKTDKQKAVDTKTFNIIQRKMTELGIKFCKDISMKDKKDYSMIIRQAESWITEY